LHTHDQILSSTGKIAASKQAMSQSFHLGKGGKRVTSSDQETGNKLPRDIHHPTSWLCTAAKAWQTIESDRATDFHLSLHPGNLGENTPFYWCYRRLEEEL
jgi:hypothetical protein